MALRCEPVVAAPGTAFVERGVGMLPGGLEQTELLQAGEGAVHRRAVQRGARRTGVQTRLHTRLTARTGAVQQPFGEIEREGVPVRRASPLAVLHVDHVQDVRFER